MKRWALILILGAAGLPVMAQQAPPPAAQEPADQDGPGVARLSVMNGDVSVRRGDSGDLVAAAPNAPLVITDRVLTGAQSRAEIQFDWADMIRVGSNAEVRLSELQYRRYQIQIAVGTTTFRVLRQSNAAVEISTPSVAIHPLGVGVYRVAVHEDGSSEITVREGEAEIFTPAGSQRLHVGSTMLARGSAEEPEFQQVAAIPLDEWDGWNQYRDQELERSRSYQYVSSEISGAEELDNHGKWVSVEGYGNVWAPTVDPGWAPYRYGRWVWEPYYGWTWVSYDSWGWAPYHYGRWFYAPVYGWCWWPGGIHEHYWRPALVAFFGWGGAGFGVGFAWGNVGWVPLAPHEPFHPWYGHGFYGGHNTTIVNNVNIVNVYRNARVTNGITAVNSNVFGRGAISNSNLVRVSGSQLQNAGLARGALPLNPARESYRLADRSVSSSAVARSVENRSFFSRQSTGAPRGGWPSAAPSYRGGSTGGQDQGGWHRFGEPAPHASSPNGSGSGAGRPTADSPGRRFGGPSGGPAPQSAPAQHNFAEPRNNGSAPVYRGGSNYAAPPSSGSPVRINPPMVRERPSNSQPSYSRPAYGGSREYSAPTAPQRSAPAPRSSGGGGGGGNSSHGGGGGGGHNRGR